jgi:hypothetical protein
MCPHKLRMCEGRYVQFAFVRVTNGVTYLRALESQGKPVVAHLLKNAVL